MEPDLSSESVFSKEEEEEEEREELQDEEEEFPAPREREELQDEEEAEDEDGDGGQMFSAWMSRYARGGQAGAVGGASAGEEESEESTDQHTDTVNTSFLPPVRRRSSLPCPSTLSAMQLNRLHSLAQAPVSAGTLLRRSSSRSLSTTQEAAADSATPQSPQSAAAALANRERRSSLVPPTIPEVERSPTRTPFRRRNVMSLSDADSTCLICHDDLHKAGKQIRELQCAHSFHNECIDAWLCRKRACPTCRLPAASNSDWSATGVKGQ